MWAIQQITGYKPMTTFWDDFSIAEVFGVDAIRDTFERAFEEWKTDYKYLTELIMVLNWKIHHWYQVDKPKAETYNELWEKADAWACENLTGDELSYFFRTTD